MSTVKLPSPSKFSPSSSEKRAGVNDENNAPEENKQKDSDTGGDLKGRSSQFLQVQSDPN